jgi:predicted Zn-dependent protease
VAVALEDQSGYQNCCAALLSKFPATNSVYSAWCFSLAQEAVEDYSAAIACARRVASNSPTGSYGRIALGAVLIRAGQWEEGHKYLNAAVARDTSGSTIWTSRIRYYLLAISLHHQGRFEEARLTLIAGNRAAVAILQTPRDWRLRLTLELLRREATQLIEPQSTDKPPSGKEEPAPDKSGKP